MSAKGGPGAAEIAVRTPPGLPMANTVDSRDRRGGGDVSRTKAPDPLSHFADEAPT